MRQVYLAGPIDAVSKEQASGWRAEAQRELAYQGFVIFNPAAAFTVGQGANTIGIQAVNWAALENSTAVLVDLRGDHKMVGTLMELGAALAMNLEVVAIVDKIEDSPHAALNDPRIWRVLTVPAAVRLIKGLAEAQEGMSSLPTLEWCYDEMAVKEAGDMNLRDVYGMPERAYEGDAGVDIPTTAKTVVPPGSFVDVPLAYRFAPAPGFWLRLTGRSSTLRKHGLLVNEGVIDQGWRGRLFAGVWNLRDEDVVIERGQRIVQAIIGRVHAAEVALEYVDGVNNLREGDRGERGFGSTGS